MIVSMLAYNRSSHCNRLQKSFAIYFKFHGLSAKAFNALHTLRITMSHKWTANCVEKLSHSAMNEVASLVSKNPCSIGPISYDNMNVLLQVFFQHIDNKSDFGSGTAATAYVKYNIALLPPNTNAMLQEKQAEGMQNPITADMIDNLANDGYATIHDYMVHRVLRYLLKSPYFASYLHSKSPCFNPPPSGYTLPRGRENVTKQYMLGSVGIPEAKYEQNLELIWEWLKQLGIITDKEKEKMAQEKLVFWCGDQLTVDRLWGLFEMRGDDSNSMERLDWMILMFGWFHFKMAFTNSLHKQYLGDDKGEGLKKAFGGMKWKGLTQLLIKGPFHHDLDEALHHTLEAHVLVDWKQISGVTDLSELTSRSPEELLKLAEILVYKNASLDALNEMDALLEVEQDDAKWQTIIFMKDTLHYVVFSEAMQEGHVKLMQDFLPHVAYRFTGGGNSNYLMEVFKLLQGIH
jgi:hypothetical protein